MSVSKINRLKVDGKDVSVTTTLLPFFEAILLQWSVDKEPFAVAVPKELYTTTSPYTTRHYGEFYLYMKSERKRLGPMSIEEIKQILEKELSSNE